MSLKLNHFRSFRNKLLRVEEKIEITDYNISLVDLLSILSKYRYVFLMCIVISAVLTWTVNEKLHPPMFAAEAKVKHLYVGANEDIISARGYIRNTDQFEEVSKRLNGEVSSGTLKRDLLISHNIENKTINIRAYGSSEDIAERISQTVGEVYIDSFIDSRKPVKLISERAIPVTTVHITLLNVMVSILLTIFLISSIIIVGNFAKRKK